MDELIISVFYDADNFYKEFELYLKEYCLSCDEKLPSKTRSSLTEAEVMIICAVFHLSGYRTFKHYYNELISARYKKFFPNLVSYSRFVELMPYVALPLTFFVYMRSGQRGGISFIDSTALDVCDNHRINQNKVFKGIAQMGKSSTGWFYGLKLHISINDRGEILNFCLTPGNIDDRNPKVIKQLTKGMFGKIFADKGYISKKLFDTLWDKGVQMITKQKKNIKNKGLMKLTDRLLLRKRAVIESVNDFLKNICQTEHSRHRSCRSFVVSLISGLAAYSYIPKKPSIRTDMTAILI